MTTKCLLNTSRVIVMLGAIIFLSDCANNDEPKPIDCASSGLMITIVSQSDPSSCLTNNGTISVSASGGASPYQFKLGTGAYGSTTSFANLSGGSYTITVKDNNGCEKQSESVVLVAPTGPVAGTPVITDQTNCTIPDGSIVINVTGGATPYMYKIGTGSFGLASSFSNLKAGVYTITVKDNLDCSITIDATVQSKTDVSFATDIKPILETNCIKSGCHNGDNGATRNWSVFSNVQANATAIKTRTGNKSMPADNPAGLPEDQIALIACWVDEGAKNN